MQPIRAARSDDALVLRNALCEYLLRALNRATKATIENANDSPRDVVPEIVFLNDDLHQLVAQLLHQRDSLATLGRVE